MLETIIRHCFGIIDRTERLIETSWRLIGSGSLGDVETDLLIDEIERLTDIVLTVDEATRLLRRTFEHRPEIARVCVVHATLQ